jgi:L-fuconolactonase
VNRRDFLGCAGAAALQSAAPQSKGVPIIDTHIHLFDQRRPQGAPYSAAPGNTEPALPARYRRIASPLGIVGAIEVEASPWVEDNLWVLQVEETDPIMVGMIGNLQPEKPEFKEYLDRYHKNKLFLGIRYGNLWGYSLTAQISNPTFIDGLKLLEQADLTLDSANPRPDLIEALIRVSDRAPGLRIVVDHLASLLRLLNANERAPVEANLRELSKRPQVYFKVSEVLQVKDGAPVTDAAVYKPTLDYLFETFGPDHLVFGSDWPNSVAVNNLPAIVTIAKDYFNAKGAAVAEKVFWRNSRKAYKWVKRRPDQPDRS